MKLTLKKIGNSVGVILPKEVLARLHLEAGDEVTLGEGPGLLTLSAHAAEIEEELQLGMDFMKRYRAAFRELAK